MSARDRDVRCKADGQVCEDCGERHYTRTAPGPAEPLEGRRVEFNETTKRFGIYGERSRFEYASFGHAPDAERELKAMYTAIHRAIEDERKRRAYWRRYGRSF